MAVVSTLVEASGPNPASGLNPAWSIALALALDLLLAELPTRLHPVAWFGSLVAPFDREWRRPKLVGVAVAAILPVLAASAVATATALATRLSPLAGVLLAGVALFTTTSLRQLVSKAREVVVATDEDLPTARERLRWLAGREATDLSPGEIRSAAIESAAENLADGLVAPLLAFAMFAPLSLALAAGAAAWVKAVNTLDSMLGYPHKPHGTASARLDDLVMWIPARASAALVALAALSPASLGGAHQWADTPPSPNSGWPMATLAVVLDSRLEKPGVYVLNDREELPSLESSRFGIRVVGVAGLLAFVVVGVWSAVAAGFWSIVASVAVSPAVSEVVAWF